MVIADLNIVRIAILEPEADPPLVINRDGMLAFAITFQPMQSVSRRYLEIIKARRKVYIFKLAYGSTGNIRREPFCLPGLIELVGPLVGERLDHR
jgi:hypothetical protein